MEYLQKDILLMKQDLTDLKQDMKQLLTISKKMNNHIDFIDDTYGQVKAPLNYICNKINYVSSGKKEIEN